MFNSLCKLKPWVISFEVGTKLVMPILQIRKMRPMEVQFPKSWNRKRKQSLLVLEAQRILLSFTIWTDHFLINCLGKSTSPGKWKELLFLSPLNEVCFCFLAFRTVLSLVQGRQVALYVVGYVSLCFPWKCHAKNPYLFMWAHSRPSAP